MIMDRLIVMDEVSDLVDRSEKFGLIIRTDLRIHFSYDLPNKTALANKNS